MIGYTHRFSYISHTLEVIYAVKSSEKVTAHVLEVKRHDPTSQSPAKYLPLGPVCTHTPSTRVTHLSFMQQPKDIPEELRDAEPHDATCFVDKVAICTPKAIYFLEPLK